VSESRSVAILAEGERMLAEASSIDDYGRVKDLAVAAAEYARVRKLGHASVAYAIEIAAIASRRMAELDPPAKPWHADSTAQAVDIPQQRRSENRDLLTFTETEVREKAHELKEPTLGRIRRLARDRRATQRPKPEPVFVDPVVRLGDFRDVLAAPVVADGTVDVVLTDPPYPAEFLELWTDLAIFARRVLKPDGLLVAMSGHIYLPEIFQRLGRELGGDFPYRWTIAYVATGHANVVHARRIHSMWKPVVVYGGTKRRLYDVARSDFAEKRDHPWGQSESGFDSLLRLVADPGQLICDPFAGGGTTAVVAKRYGCSFIGAEIDERHWRTANLRADAA
jgi:site-specific DNA-methyltransferase (adenine-specific)